MKAILDELDKQINAALPGDGVLAYGLSILSKKGAAIQPITIIENKQSGPNDHYDVTYYHRLLTDPVEADEEFMFGNKMPRRHKQGVRTVIFVKKKMSDEYIDTFIDAIPEFITLDGYKFINLVNAILENNDQEAIYIAEFGDGDYEKHRTAYFIYALEYDVDYIKCAA